MAFRQRRDHESLFAMESGEQQSRQASNFSRQRRVAREADSEEALGILREHMEVRLRGKARRGGAGLAGGASPWNGAVGASRSGLTARIPSADGLIISSDGIHARRRGLASPNGPQRGIRRAGTRHCGRGGSTGVHLFDIIAWVARQGTGRWWVRSRKVVSAENRGRELVAALVPLTPVACVPFVTGDLYLRKQARAGRGRLVGRGSGARRLCGVAATFAAARTAARLAAETAATAAALENLQAVLEDAVRGAGFAGNAGRRQRAALAVFLCNWASPPAGRGERRSALAASDAQSLAC